MNGLKCQTITDLISIHAPRVGSDNVVDTLKLKSGISIHAPRVGSDIAQRDELIAKLEFQSTLPVWGATAGWEAELAKTRISIHAPRVGSDADAQEQLADVEISIHAPRVGSD